MPSRVRAGGDERARLQVLAAHRVAPGAKADGGFLKTTFRAQDLGRLAATDGDGEITAVAFSPDGTLIVSGSSDGPRAWGPPETHHLNS